MPFCTSPSSNVEYEHIEDVERLEYYRPGGYHPMTIGDRLRNRYRVVHKLGFGTYSTTWLARDEERNSLVAVKVGTTESNIREIEILSTLARAEQHSKGDSCGRSLIPRLLDSFKIEGPNGVHPCYVTAPGRTSLSGAKDGSYRRLFTLEVARALAAQLALAVAFTHAQGFVHGDLHLGNVLLRLPREFDSLSDDQLYDRYGAPELEPVRRLEGGALPPGVPLHGVQSVWLGKPSEEVQLSEAQILLVDFGEAFSPAHETRCESHTPLSIQPPEARFEAGKPLSFPADIWTMACTIWAVLAQRSLFEDILATPDNITCEQIDVLGDLPAEWWNKWEARRQWFNEDGSPIKDRFLRRWEVRFEDSVQEPRRRGGMPTIEAEEKEAIFGMLRSMLSFKPEIRLTAGQVLESRWMQKWALPAYDKMRSYSGSHETG